MLPKTQIEKIRKSDLEALIVRKEYLESVVSLLKELSTPSYKGYNLYEIQKELDYIMDVIAFDFTPKR